jgi:hypothetical protein
VLPELSLPGGRYRLTADALPAGVSLSLRARDGSRVERSGKTWLVATQADDGEEPEVDLVCDVPATVALPFSIESVSITKAP